MYNRIEVDREVCGCQVKKNTWARHVKTEKLGKELRGEAVMDKLVGIWN